MSKYYAAKVTFLFGDKDTGKKMLNQVLATAEFMDNSQLVDEITTLIY